MGQTLSQFHLGPQDDEIKAILVKLRGDILGIQPDSSTQSLAPMVDGVVATFLNRGGNKAFQVVKPILRVVTKEPFEGEELERLILDLTQNRNNEQAMLDMLMRCVWNIKRGQIKPAYEHSALKLEGR